MGIRTGQEFIDGLRARPRDVWVKGQRVDDVTAHPAFAGVVRQLARLYDAQSDPIHADTLTCPLANGDRVGTAFVPARTQAELAKRRRAYQTWAEMNFGLIGRSPDFLNVTLLAFAEARAVFDRGGTQFGDRVVRYYEYVRDNDLFLSQALIAPQNDGSKSSLRVVRETPHGIVVAGARMIATLGAVSDEMIICNPPMFKPGDEDHALMFAVPTDVPGLRQICREPYNMGERASFDHPLASRFAEIDSLLIFKDVFVPWDRVFCYRDIGLSNAIYPECGLRNHTAHQTDARALVKLQFAAGLAVAVARAIKADRFPHVQQMLGEALGYVEMVKSALVRSEAECEPTPAGTMRPALAPLQALGTFLPTAYPRVIEILRAIAAEKLTMMPSGADLACDELAQDAALYCQGADGLFRLARDLAGDAFGSRLPHDAGDSAGNYLGCDDREMMRLVRAALDLAGDPSQ